MRLLHIQTLELGEFIEGSIPPYAILSHRWSSEELTFKEVAKHRIETHKKGYRKLLEACKVAAKYNVTFIWIDTCCIDKRSSAELSEAINSMCIWYQSAAVCLAYLEDAKSGSEFEETFRASEWFTRSWTLQELLAPQMVEFYSCDWVYVGSKNSNASIIEEVTGITFGYLTHWDSCLRCCIAEKMSWAADRRATRPEDVAYSLVGLFGVNMPLLYGEGQRAFARLQHEIIRLADDTTFLLWGLGDSTHRLLASSPADFRDSGRIREIRRPSPHIQLKSTNVGLEVESYIARWGLHVYSLLVAARGPQENFAVLVRKLPWADAYYKVGTGIQFVATPLALSTWTKHRKMSVVWGNEGRFDNDYLAVLDSESEDYCFVVDTEAAFTMLSPITLHYGDPVQEEHITITSNQDCLRIDFQDANRPAVAKLIFQLGFYSKLFVSLAFDFDSNPCALIHTHKDERNLWEIADSIEKPNLEVGGYGECKMINATGNEPGSHAFFFRNANRHRDTFARIPGEILADAHPIWIHFICPSSLYNDSHCWKFRVSSSPPQHHHRFRL